MSSHSECAISNLSKTGYVPTYHKILKVCSHKTLETLLLFLSYTALHAAFFFNVHVVPWEGASTYYQYSCYVYIRILKVRLHQPHKVAPHNTTPKQTEQNHAKLCRLVLKKNCSSMHMPVPLFACKRGKPQTWKTWKSCGLLTYWNIPLHFGEKYFEKKTQSSVETPSLGNTIIQK